MSHETIGFLTLLYIVGIIAAGFSLDSLPLGVLWPIYLPLAGIKEMWMRLRE